MASLRSSSSMKNILSFSAGAGLAFGAAAARRRSASADGQPGKSGRSGQQGPFADPALLAGRLIGRSYVLFTRLPRPGLSLRIPAPAGHSVDSPVIRGVIEIGPLHGLHTGLALSMVRDAYARGMMPSTIINKVALEVIDGDLDSDLASDLASDLDGGAANETEPRRLIAQPGHLHLIGRDDLDTADGDEAHPETSLEDLVNLTLDLATLDLPADNESVLDYLRHTYHPELIVRGSVELILGLVNRIAAEQSCGDPECDACDAAASPIRAASVMAGLACAYTSAAAEHMPSCRYCVSRGDAAPLLVRARLCQEITADLITNADPENVYLTAPPFEALLHVIDALVQISAAISDMTVAQKLDQLLADVAYLNISAA